MRKANLTFHALRECNKAMTPLKKGHLTTETQRTRRKFDV